MDAVQPNQSTSTFSEPTVSDRSKIARIFSSPRAQAQMKGLVFD